jgi:hypothetical protein
MPKAGGLRFVHSRSVTSPPGVLFPYKINGVGDQTVGTASLQDETRSRVGLRQHTCDPPL